MNSLKTVMAQILLLVLLVTLATCGGQKEDQPATGSIPIQIVWPESGSAQSAGGIASPATACPTCTTLSGTVTGPGISTKSFSFDFTAHTGTISGVPAGSGRAISAQAKDASNAVLFTGSASGITVPAGGNSSPVTLAMISTSCTWQRIGSIIGFGSGIESSLVWTGSEFGVSWSAGGIPSSNISFARISSAGSKIGSDAMISSVVDLALDSSLVWTGSEFGVSWEDNRNGNFEIYFARISNFGNIIGSEVRITFDADGSRFPSLVWALSEFGVSWQEHRDGNWEIYFARISSAGAKIGSDIRITYDPADSGESSIAEFPSPLVWTGSEYGSSWFDTRDGIDEIYFARISAGGNKIGSDVRITYSNSDSPRLVWTGSEFGLSWADYRNINWQISFSRISASGNKIGSDVPITSNSIGAETGSLVWTGSEFGASWDDNRDGNYEIYFARISANGSKIGSEVRITYDSVDSYLPSLAYTGSEYGVSWWVVDQVYFSRIGCQ